MASEGWRVKNLLVVCVPAGARGPGSHILTRRSPGTGRCWCDNGVFGGLPAAGAGAVPAVLPGSLPPLSSPLVYSTVDSPQYVSARFDLWKVGWPILSDYPVLGSGINNAVVVSLKYPDPDGVFWKTSFHNFYLTTWIEIGIVGLGLFLATLAMASWLAFSLVQATDKRTGRPVELVVEYCRAGGAAWTVHAPHGRSPDR